MLPRGLLRRQLCTATGPRLPRWGSFGKTQEQLEKTVAQISEVNERQVCSACAWPPAVATDPRRVAIAGVHHARPGRLWAALCRHRHPEPHVVRP